MKAKELFCRFNQFGFERDAFDSYREAVNRSNRGSLQVLSVMGVVSAVLVSIYGLVTHENIVGAWFCGFLLITGIIAITVSFRPDSPRKSILLSGYFLMAGYFVLAVYGSVSKNTDAFWMGTQMGLCCYILDYAWRPIVLELLSYGLLMLSWWVVNPAKLTTDRLVFSSFYLLAGIVTFYAIGRAKLALIMRQEESQQQADTDLLTGLTIRTAAEDRIREILENGEDSGVMILLDLDRFKSVNDMLGHQKGDRVLIEVAADLKKMFRSSDVLTRLGGDEFVVYMQGVPEETWARDRAEQVVRTVRRWVGDGTTNIQVTASVGVAMTGVVGRNYADLYRAADIAMYFAKAANGNQAIMYSPELIRQQRAPAAPEEGTRTLAEHNEGAEDLR